MTIFLLKPMGCNYSKGDLLFYYMGPNKLKNLTFNLTLCLYLAISFFSVPSILLEYSSNGVLEKRLKVFKGALYKMLGINKSILHQNLKGRQS